MAVVAASPVVVAPPVLAVAPAPVLVGGSTTVVAQAETVPAVPAPAPTVPAPLPGAPETGLRITGLGEGTAKSAGLHPGDIILSIDGARTQTLPEVRAALTGGKVQVVVEYIDAATGSVERRSVGVADGKLGVLVTEVPVGRA